MNIVRTVVWIVWIVLIGSCGSEPSNGEPSNGHAPTREPVNDIVSNEDLHPVIVLARDRTEERLDRPVELSVPFLRGQGRWAFLTAVPTMVDGSDINYLDTRYAADYEDGFFDNWLCALAERGPNGWVLVAYELGATDAPFVDWPRRYGAPEALFNLKRN